MCGWCVALAACCASAPVRAAAEPLAYERRSIFAVDPVVDASVIGASTALAFLPLAFGDAIVTPTCPCDPSAVNALDRGAIGNSSQAADTASGVTALVAVAAPLGFEFATLGASSAFLEDAIVFGQTVLVSNALANIAKLAVQRPRPEVYATRDPSLLRSTGGYLSFYSGHTTNTFAALSAASMILHLRYGTGFWPWVATALIGGSVAVERVLAGKHFPTDVTVGAAMGIAEGIMIPYFHIRRPHAPAVRLSLEPITQGARLVWRREFRRTTRPDARPVRAGRWFRHVRVSVSLVAVTAAFGCAPPMSMRPIGGLPLTRNREVGAAFAGVGPRRYAEESWQGVGQAWASTRVSRAIDLSAITAFDTSGFALGAAARFAFVRGSRVWLGAEAEAGWLWTAAVLHVSLKIAGELRVYAAPRLGNWGADWTPGIPLGLSIPIYDGFVVRAEGQISWADFKYYNRRLLAAGAVVYQW